MTARAPWRSLAIAAAALVAAAIPGAFDALVLERGTALVFEPWRLLTGHLVHITPYHLAWNVAALVVLGLIFEPVLRGRLWGVLAASAVTVGLGCATLLPTLDAYCGLSGILNGVLVGGALAAFRQERTAGNRRTAALMVVAVAVTLLKIAVEAWSGRALFTDVAALGGHPVPLAHALGALGGTLVRPSRRP